MSKAIAFLAGLGSGYVDQTDRNKENARRDAEEKRRQAEFEALQAERARTLADRQALRDAAAPIPVTAQELAGPVDPGNAIPAAAAPMPTAYKVGPATFASRGIADQAAEQQRQTRITSVADQIDPLGAQGRKTQQMQGQVAEAQLKKILKEAEDEGALKFLSAASNGADARTLEALYNAQGKDKIRNVQVQPIVSDHPLMKGMPSVRITATREDGTPFVIPDAQGYGASLMDMYKQAGLLREAKRDQATADYHAGQLKVSQQNADSLEKQRQDTAAYQRAQLGMEQQRLNLAKQQAQQSGVVWTKDDDKAIEHAYTAKDADGNQVTDANGATFAKQVALAASVRLGGDTMRARMQALDVDAALKTRAAALAKESGGKVTLDQALRNERAAYLNALYAPPAATQRPPSNVTGIAAAPPGGVVRQGDKWVPQGSTPAAQAAQGVAPTAQPGGTPDAPPADAARTRLEAANAKVQSYGSKQRQQDPAGFRAAQAELTAAAQAAAQADAAYAATLGSDTSRPGFRMPSP